MPPPDTFVPRVLGRGSPRPANHGATRLAVSCFVRREAEDGSKEGSLDGRSQGGTWPGFSFNSKPGVPAEEQTPGWPADPPVAYAEPPTPFRCSIQRREKLLNFCDLPGGTAS